MIETKAPAPSYYGWHPTVESAGDVLSVLLTRGRQHEAPLSGGKFAASVASATGLSTPPLMFGCDEFVTCYFDDGSHGDRQWEECWDMRLLLAQKIPKHSVKNLVAFPIEESPDSVGEFRVQITLRVIADFDSEKLVAKCKDSLQDRAHAQSIRWPDRYSVRDVAPRHQQLCVDVGMRERSRIAELLPDAITIMTICQELGGRTHASGIPPA